MKFEKISQEDREKLERRLYKTIVEEFRREKIKDGYYKYIVSLQEFKFITDITDNELKESISIAVDTMEELKKINNNDGMNKKKLKEIQDKEHRGEPFETLNIWNAIVTEQLKELLNRAWGNHLFRKKTDGYLIEGEGYILAGRQNKIRKRVWKWEKEYVQKRLPVVEYQQGASYLL